MKNHILKNDLSKLMKKKGVTQYELANRTGLNKTTIRKIVNNEFHDMKMSTLQLISDALDIDWSEIMVEEEDRMLFTKHLIPYEFNKDNLEVFKAIMKEIDSSMKISWEQYSDYRKTNLYIKNEKIGVKIFVNMSIFLTEHGITLTIVDLDMYDKKNLEFYDYKGFYKNILIGFEKYANEISIDAIRFNIRSYINPVININDGKPYNYSLERGYSIKKMDTLKESSLIMPVEMKDSDLIEMYKIEKKYSSINELIKWTLLINLNFKKDYQVLDRELKGDILKTKKADKYSELNQDNHIYIREKLRQKFYNNNFKGILYDRYLYKIINFKSKYKFVYKQISRF